MDRIKYVNMNCNCSANPQSFPSYPLFLERIRTTLQMRKSGNNVKSHCITNLRLVSDERVRNIMRPDYFTGGLYTSYLLSETKQCN